MKKFITLSLLLTISVSIFAQNNKEIRNWDPLVLSMIGKKCSKKENRIYNQKGYPKWKEYSLKAESPEKLTTIEQELLKQYEDVVITKFSHGYFLIEDDAIGVASKSGKTLVEPVHGKVRVVIGGGYSNLHVFGEKTSDFDIWNEMVTQMTNNANYDIAIPIGLFKGVAMFTSHPAGFQEIIPSGKYDFISLVVRSKTGLSNKRTGFYVYKQQANGELLCGYCDIDGKEIIPCKYRSIYFDGNSFIGDNTKTMLEWNEIYINKMNFKKDIAEQKRAQWASVLNATGNTINNIVGNTNNGQQQPFVNTKTPSNKSNKKSAADLTSRNTAYKAYEGYANELIKMANGQISYNDNLRRQYQSEMKKIRTKWEHDGYQFTKLQWEDWKGL